MREAQICLPYFLQGSDLGFRLDGTETVGDALEAHAAAMDEAAEALRRVKAMVKGEDVEFDACCDSIFVSGPEEVIEDLIAAGLACTPDYDDDDEDCCSDCCSRRHYEKWQAMARRGARERSSGRNGSKKTLHRVGSKR
jgi:hypothetical protein